jgi:hypothetical protein
MKTRQPRERRRLEQKATTVGSVYEGADMDDPQELLKIAQLGNRWLPQNTCANCARWFQAKLVQRCVQAIFFRRRHQPRRPPLVIRAFA